MLAPHTNPPTLDGYYSRGGKLTASFPLPVRRMVKISHARGRRSTYYRPAKAGEASRGWLSEDSDPSLISLASILFLTTNTIAAAIRARDDPSMVAFVVSIYAFLMLFFWCVRAFDRLPHKSKARQWLKVPIWVLGSTLNLMFAHRVTIITANAMAWLVWSLAASSCLFTFYFFFLYSDKPIEKHPVCEREPFLVGEV